MGLAHCLIRLPRSHWGNYVERQYVALLLLTALVELAFGKRHIRVLSTFISYIYRPSH
jgi:hypothetical protein